MVVGYLILNSKSWTSEMMEFDILFVLPLLETIRKAQKALTMRLFGAVQWHRRKV